MLDILISYHVLFSSQRYGTVNILMRYNGDENKSTCCSLSHIIIKSPEHG